MPIFHCLFISASNVKDNILLITKINAKYIQNLKCDKRNKNNIINIKVNVSDWSVYLAGKLRSTTWSLQFTLLFTFLSLLRQSLMVWRCALAVTKCILVAIALPSTSRVCRLGRWWAKQFIS